MKNSGSSGRREMVEGEDINYYDVDVEVEWGIVLTELKQPMMLMLVVLMVMMVRWIIIIVIIIHKARPWDAGIWSQRKKNCAPARRNQAEAHVDVVGLAAAATDEGSKVLGVLRRLRVVNDLSSVEIEKIM